MNPRAKRRPTTKPESAPSPDPVEQGPADSVAGEPMNPAVPSASTDMESKTDAKPRKTETAPRYRLKMVGIGGAGGNMIQHLSGDGDRPVALPGLELLAINTDRQALGELGEVEKIQIGAAVTHGLGTGGDPELGSRAAQQDERRIGAALESADVVFLCVGLGGGTGGGAAPLVARLARGQGALVLAFVVLPFNFEGERRRQQAQSALEQLRAQADAVIAIPNDKLFKLTDAESNVQDAFRQGDELVAGGARAIWQLLSRKGLINLDFAALRQTLGGRQGEGLFSFGEASGPDRAEEALSQLMGNPLLDGIDALAKAEGVLVSILGGPDLTLPEVQKIVEPISRAAKQAHVIMGAAIDEEFRDRLAVTVIAGTKPQPKRTHVPVETTGLPPARARLVVPGKPLPRSALPATPASSSAAAAAEAPARKEPAKPRQETLPLAEVGRGRFDRTEPTLYDGEDLDVPTFIRRGVSLKR